MADFGPEGNRAFAAFRDVLTTNVQNGRVKLDGQTNDTPKFWISITQGGAGWFAVKLWDGDGFAEPWESGEGRYKTASDAEREARQWAAEENLEFIR